MSTAKTCSDHTNVRQHKLYTSILNSKARNISNHMWLLYEAKYSQVIASYINMVYRTTSHVEKIKTHRWILTELSHNWSQMQESLEPFVNSGHTLLFTVTRSCIVSKLQVLSVSITTTSFATSFKRPLSLIFYFQTEIIP